MIEISQPEAVAAGIAALTIEIAKLVILKVENKNNKRKKI